MRANDAGAALPQRPLTILVAALGGEGGAVLADWIRDVAIASDYPIQSTSIPGVAQRTGATTYYLELYPVRLADLGGLQPVFALTPCPGDIDLMVASELVEAGRAMQNGFVSARTTLIAATHRVYATSEKMQIGDGRYDAERIVDAGPQLARRAAFIDMAALAQESRTLISAVMFGAIASSDVLPFSRASCEDAIRAGGVGVEASLRGFAAGWAAIRSGAQPAAADQQATQTALPVAFEQRIAGEIPAAMQTMVREGVRRTLDYQDARYATLYLDRLTHATADGSPITSDTRAGTETARFLALWMSYEDVIRVADLKTRHARVERVRNEVLAGADEPVRVIEYLRPGIPELCDLLPVSLSEKLRRWATVKGRMQRLGFGMHVSTSSVSGFALMRLLALLRRWRPRSARYLHEQSLIEDWLAAIRSGLRDDPALALEIALAARLIKGYGDTHERGAARFGQVMAVAADRSIAPTERAAAVRAAREAALANPEAKTTQRKPGEQPVTFVKPPGRANATGQPSPGR